MKKIKLLMFNAMLFSLVAVSCGGNTQSTNTTTQPPTSVITTTSNTTKEYRFTEKNVKVNYMNNKLNQETKLRFFEEMEDIPYIEMNNFYKLLLKGTKLESKPLTIKRNDTKYVITTSRGGQATYDGDSNLFESNDFALFNCINYFDETANGVMALDGMPWVRINNVVYDTMPLKFSVDFDDYDIKLFAIGDEIYFPIQTINDLFTNMNLLGISYNQENIYVINGSNEEELESFEYAYSEMKNKTLSKRYAKYNYDEICFNYDYLLGRPRRSSFSRYYNNSLGIDKALEQRPLGKRIKELLKSNVVSEYLTGTSLLNYLLADGGHTNYIQAYYYKNYVDESVANTISTLLSAEFNKNYEELLNTDRTYAEHRSVRNTRGLAFSRNTSANLVGPDSYIPFKSGETAMIAVDDFMGEVRHRKAWDEYYAGTRATIPFGTEGDVTYGGAVGNIYFGIKKAKEANVKNIIVDLASNNGGSLDELVYLISALTGNKSFKMYNYTNARCATIYYDVDINLDKKFDEKDVALTDGLTVSALISQNGFSCGGISPVYLHDLGVYTLGDYSGGGSCAIYYNYDAYGLSFINSCPFQIMSPKGAQIDSVRYYACDQFLDKSYDYEEFYDETKLEEYINEHFYL